MSFTLTKRKLPFFVLGGALVTVFLVSWHRHTLTIHASTPCLVSPKSPTEDPPMWDWLLKWEAELPQHDLHLNEKPGRYVRFSNQAHHLGWNNIQGELLMNAHLAHASGRGSVFFDYKWDPRHYPWSESEALIVGREWPPRTPLNAILSGPVVGGLWNVDDVVPPSISNITFDVVCPEDQRLVVQTSDIKKGMEWASGEEVLKKWTDFLRDTPERCVDIVPSSDDGFPQIFDLWLWGNDRLLSLWDSFSKSPVSTLLSPSGIVKAAVDRNEYLFVPRQWPRSSAQIGISSPYERVLALHIRRGDYEGACQHFAKWSSTFYGWNQLTFLPDRFIPPEGSSWGENTPENTEIYMQRCLPSLESVVRKIRHARDDYQGHVLDIIYLLTNEQGEWLEELMNSLRNDGWSSVRTTRELILVTAEQKEVSMAIDMEIARRAGLFIGNGWSSFTSSIVHRRLVDKRDPSSIRFF